MHVFKLFSIFLIAVFLQTYTFKHHLWLEKINLVSISKLSSCHSWKQPVLAKQRSLKHDPYENIRLKKNLTWLSKNLRIVHEQFTPEQPDHITWNFGILVIYSGSFRSSNSLSIKLKFNVQFSCQHNKKKSHKKNVHKIE